MSEYHSLVPGFTVQCLLPPPLANGFFFNIGLIRFKNVSKNFRNLYKVVKRGKVDTINFFISYSWITLHETSELPMYWNGHEENGHKNCPSYPKFRPYYTEIGPFYPEFGVKWSISEKNRHDHLSYIKLLFIFFFRFFFILSLKARGNIQ